MDPGKGFEGAVQHRRKEARIGRAHIDVVNLNRQHIPTDADVVLRHDELSNIVDFAARGCVGARGDFITGDPW